MSSENMPKSMVHVYTGNGKGKTTAALGLALRALGHGRKVLMIQFMKKNKKYGEYIMMEKLARIKQFGTDEFVNQDEPRDIDISEAEAGMAYAEQMARSGDYDILILDEINVAVSFGLIPEDRVIDMIENRAECTEIILTGRDATDKLIEHADLVTRMEEVKHYFNSGIGAREGIEY